MLRTLCLTALLGCAFGHGYDEMIRKYGEKKIFESCFGEELFNEKMEEFFKYCKECKEEIKKGSPASADTSAGASSSPQMLDLQNIFKGNFGTQPQFFLLQLPVAEGSGIPSQRRAKRHAHYFTKEKIQGLKDKAEDHIDMAICVLKKYNMLNSYNEVTWDKFEKLYHELDVEPELKEDLLEAFNKCKNYAMCIGPDERSSAHFPHGLKQAIRYFKCENKKKMAACCRKDLRKKPDMFELEGLGNFLSNYDDDEKMQKILMMQAKFGENPHAIFD